MTDYSHMYENKFNNLYDLSQDIEKYIAETGEEIIYWSTFWKDGPYWYRSWKNKECNKSWIFDPEGYDGENGNWNYDFEKFGSNNFVIIFKLIANQTENNYLLLTKMFNHGVFKILDLKAFL